MTAPSAQRLLRKAWSIVVGTISRTMPLIKLRAGAGGHGQAWLDASHNLPPHLIYPARNAFAVRRHANQSPSMIKDGKIPSFMQLRLFSSLFLSLADRVGIEKGRMGERHQGEGNYHQIRKPKREGKKGREKEKTDANSWSCSLQT